MKTKKCGGYRGVWKCEGDYPDHMVPVENFGPSKGGQYDLDTRCRKCSTYRDSVRNPQRPRHPETGKLKVDWVTARAKVYYGGMPADRRTDKHWKLCYAKANEDANTIEWVRPSVDGKPVLTLVKNNPPKPAAQPMRKRVGGTMEGEVVPQGWVYMIGNPEIPHLLKIGRTYPDGIDSRLSEAQRWGRAELVGKFWFDDANEAEKRIHAMLYKWNLRTMGYTDCGKELFHVSTSMVEKVVEEYTKELESSENAVG